MRLFITVGTTKFDSLIDLVTSKEFQSACTMLFDKITIQYGNSTLENKISSENVELYKFKPSISSDVQQSDLIITAGGSGTILECLQQCKRVIAVPNTTLQDNHQIELCNKLSEMHHIQISKLDELLEKVQDYKAFKPQPWAPAKGSEILDPIIDELIGDENGN